MAVKRIRINEDFDQRLNYLIKQYGSGWLYSDSGFAILMKNDIDIDYFNWEGDNDKITYISDRKSLDNKVGYIDKTESFTISDDIINFIYKDIKSNFVKDVALRFIAKEIFILENSIVIHIPVDLTNYYDGENIYYPDNLRFNSKGNCKLTVGYNLKLNNKPLDGEILSLLTDMEIIA